MIKSFFLQIWFTNSFRDMLELNITPIFLTEFDGVIFEFPIFIVMFVILENFVFVPRTKNSLLLKFTWSWCVSNKCLVETAFSNWNFALFIDSVVASNDMYSWLSWTYPWILCVKFSNFVSRFVMYTRKAMWPIQFPCWTPWLIEEQIDYLLLIFIC